MVQTPRHAGVSFPLARGELFPVAAELAFGPSGIAPRLRFPPCHDEKTLFVLACFALTLRMPIAAALGAGASAGEMTLRVLHDGKGLLGFDIALFPWPPPARFTLCSDQWGGERDLFRFV